MWIKLISPRVKMRPKADTKLCMPYLLFTVFQLLLAQLMPWPAFAEPTAGGSIHGSVNDGTPDYSEWRFKRLERVTASYHSGNDGDGREGEKDIWAALLPLIETRKPLPNVTVILRTNSTVPGTHDLLLKTVTDSQGKFIFPGVPRGEYNVIAEVRQRWWAHTVQIQKQIEHYHSYATVDLIYYSNATSVRGRITDSAGRPIASAQVTATDYKYKQKTSQEGAVHSHIVSTLSARDGSYVLTGLMPGNAYSGPATYDFRAEKEGYVTAEMSLPVITEDVFSAHTRLMRLLLKSSGRDGEARLADWERETRPQPSRKNNTITGINLILGTPSVLAGRVADPQARPQSGCEVWLDPVKNRSIPLVQDVRGPKRAYTDGQGAFECRGVPAGRYTFRVGKDNRWVNAGPTNFMIGEGLVVTGITLNIDLQPLSQIKVRVRTQNTELPLTNFAASVWVVSNPKEYSSTRGDVKLKSFGPGTFSVEKISPGKAELEITAPGYVTEHLYINVPPGETVPLYVQMMRSGTANIHIIRDNVPLEPSENLQAFSVESGAVTYGRNGPKKGGGFEIQGLKPGPYIIRAHVFDGYKCIRYETAPSAIEADKTSNVTLDFSGSNTLAISLSMPPDLRAQIWLETADAPPNQPFEKNLNMCAYLWPERTGKYEVKHLRPGTYRVCAKLIDPTKGKVAMPELPSPQNQTITVEAGKTLAVGFHF